jgi:arginine N-succinyltransferase
MNPIEAREATAADLPAIQALIGRRVELPRAAGERLFVSEHAQGGLEATLRLRPPIGLQRPRWWYHVGCAVHAAAEIGVLHRQPTLLLGNDLTGAAELSDIGHRDDSLPAVGAVLATVLTAALDAIAREPEVYGERLIAELPGRRDAQGRSPFWLGLGRHFYAGDPLEAEAHHGRAWRSHVAALLPRQLVYTSFLPDDAQAAIGAVAEAAQPQAAALAAAGWRYQGHVRIDDAGPVLERAIGR